MKVKIITAAIFIPLLIVTAVPYKSTGIYDTSSKVAYAKNSEHYDEILSDVQKEIKAGNITFLHENDKNGLLYHYGYIKRKDGQWIQANIRVLKTLRYLTKYKNYELEIMCILGTHSKYTTSGNISRHWYGRGLDISAINGRKIKWGAGEETEAVMKILNDFQYKYPHLTPKQLICEGDGKKNYSIARYSMSNYKTVGQSFSYRVGGHKDHIHVGW